jgi:hypothetical protein
VSGRATCAYAKAQILEIITLSNYIIDMCQVATCAYDKAQILEIITLSNYIIDMCQVASKYLR